MGSTLSCFLIDHSFSFSAGASVDVGERASVVQNMGAEEPSGTNTAATAEHDAAHGFLCKWYLEDQIAILNKQANTVLSQLENSARNKYIDRNSRPNVVSSMHGVANGVYASEEYGTNAVDAMFELNDKISKKWVAVVRMRQNLLHIASATTLENDVGSINCKNLLLYSSNDQFNVFEKLVELGEHISSLYDDINVAYMMYVNSDASSFSSSLSSLPSSESPPSHTHIIYDRGLVMTEEERKELVNWAKDLSPQLHKLQYNRSDYTLRETDPRVHSLVWQVKARIIEREGLQSFRQEPYLQDFLGVVHKSGHIHLHRDPNTDNLIHSRFNVIIQGFSGIGDSKASTYYAGRPVHVREGSYVISKSGVDYHWTDVNDNDNDNDEDVERYSLSFGFLLPPAFIQQRRL